MSTFFLWARFQFHLFPPFTIAWETFLSLPPISPCCQASLISALCFAPLTIHSSHGRRVEFKRKNPIDQISSAISLRSSDANILFLDIETEHLFSCCKIFFLQQEFFPYLKKHSCAKKKNLMARKKLLSLRKFFSALENIFVSVLVP